MLLRSLDGSRGSCVGFVVRAVTAALVVALVAAAGTAQGAQSFVDPVGDEESAPRYRQRDGQLRPKDDAARVRDLDGKSFNTHRL